MTVQAVSAGPLSWLRRVRRVVVVTGLVAFTLLGVVSVASPGAAQPLPFCGGQNAAPRPVPYTCTTQTQSIDSSQVFAILFADGQTVTVTYHLLAPRSTDAAIRIVHHVGISGAGGPRTEASGVIPAGQTEATLMVVTPCAAGQVDIKFVFILDSQPQGRVGGPWITNGTGCTAQPTTTTTATTTSTTTTSIPTTTIPSRAISTTAPAVPSTALGLGRTSTLPQTGTPDTSAFELALLAVAVGCFLVVIAARRMGDETD